MNQSSNRKDDHRGRPKHQRPKQAPYRGQLLSLRFGPTDPAVLEELIDTACQGGMNLLCLELEKGLRLESHPELAAPWAMRKEELRGIIARARRGGMEVVPALTLFSHQEYVLKAHPEWRCWQTNCPDFSHPGLRRLELDLLDEVSDLFEPRFLHIGHDEAIDSYDARFRRSVVPASKRRPAWRVFGDHVNWLHGHLANRGVRTMMWADMFLDPAAFQGACFAHSGCYGGAPDHFERALDDLPRDIVMCDWHYEIAREFPTVRYLQDKGFETIGCGRFPVNMALFTRYALERRTERFVGMMTTSWNVLNRQTSPKLQEVLSQNAVLLRSPGRYVSADASLKKILAMRPPGRLGAGRFCRSISFGTDGLGPLQSTGWSDLRYAEYQKTTDHRIGGEPLPGGMDLRNGRLGRIGFTLKASRGKSFRELAIRTWMPSASVKAITLRTASGDHTIVRRNSPLRGARFQIPLELLNTDSAQFDVTVENTTGKTCRVLSKIEIEGLIG